MCHILLGRAALRPSLAYGEVLTEAVTATVAGGTTNCDHEPAFDDGT